MKHVRYNLFVVGLVSSNRFCGPVEFGTARSTGLQGFKGKIGACSTIIQGWTGTCKSSKHSKRRMCIHYDQCLHKMSKT